MDERKEEKKLTDIETVKKMVAPTTFNALGIVPTSSSYEIMRSDLEKYLLNFTRKWLADIKYLSLIPNNKGMVATVVWLDSNSKHFRDNSTVNTAIGRSLKKYSSEIKDFASKFGDGNGKKGNIQGCIVYPDDNRNLVGIKINIMKFLRVMFDVDNVEYNQVIGGKSRPNCQLIAEWHFKSHRDNQFAEIEYLKIEKVEKNLFKDRAPKAIRSGRF